jgi:dTDP-glucose 4,6-dehydratase|tara:strand:- start:279 stop:1199 length:921 start_codon:yes stop_codon:yes gene_type:complete
MRVIVTGGLGFIGSSFVNLLNRRLPNDEIVILDKMTYAADPNNINKPTHIIMKDICDVTPEDLGDYDYIVHFAAESHVDNSIKDGKPFIRTNVEGTFNLLECAKQNKNLKKFIHISTDEVYGDMDDIGILTEANECYPIKGSSYYSATKAASDLLVEAAGRTFGLPYLITRTCNNYGSHQNEEKFIPKIMKSIANDLTIPVYGDGKQVREWIDVEDNVQLIYELMLSDQLNEVYNIGSGERYQNIQIINMIGKILGKTPKFEFVEDRLGHDKRYALDSTRVREIFPEWITLSFEEFLLEEVNTVTA